jgi:hypothetical protein
MLVPSGLITEHSPGAYNIHPHTPGFGGEIAWNDIQAIKTINGVIRNQNREIALQHNLQLEELEIIYDTPLEDAVELTGRDLYLYRISRQLIPYVLPMDPSGYPSDSYNKHDHVNEFSGGAIHGAGNHDHRGAGYAGYSFSVYHPGTRIPLKSYIIEV